MVMGKANVFVRITFSKIHAQRTAILYISILLLIYMPVT